MSNPIAITAEIPVIKMIMKTSWAVWNTTEESSTMRLALLSAIPPLLIATQEYDPRSLSLTFRIVRLECIPVITCSRPS